MPAINPYPEGFEKVCLPAGKIGEARVDHFTVSEADVQMENIRSIVNFRSRHRIIPAGRYTRLVVDGELMMTDTPAEAWENHAPVSAARGKKRILLNGLGLGFVLKAILRLPVESVTVVERSFDVLCLVGPHYTDPRITLVHGDALTWRPAKGVRFDVVWHDIWPTICGGNLPEMHRLHRAYGQRSGWQGSWSRNMIERLSA